MSIAIIHHVQNNTLGALQEVLSARRLSFDYVDCHQLSEAHGDLSDITGLIILGGKESAADDHIHPFMQPEQRMIRNAISQNLPVFGICLGSQMIARSLGAIVEKNKMDGQEIKEIGWTPLQLTPQGLADPVLCHLEGVPQFQWHEDTFHWPSGAIPLAASEWCPRQAYRLNQPSNKTYGVQFHPEVSMSVIAAWLRESDSLDASQKAAIWSETEQHFEKRHLASRKMFAAFCDSAF
mgnify:CR=1 FL=1